MSGMRDNFKPVVGVLAQVCWACAVVAVALAPLTAGANNLRQEAILPADDGLDPAQAVLVLNDDAIAEMTLIGSPVRDDDVGFTFIIVGTDGCRFRATFWGSAPSVGMSRTCDWEEWVAENTRVVSPGDLVVPMWEIPEFLQGFFENGHYDPDNGDPDPNDDIPPPEDFVEIENECGRAAIVAVASLVGCGASAYLAFGTGGLGAVVAVAACAIALTATIDALAECEDYPEAIGVNWDMMGDWVMTHDQFTPADVQDIYGFVDPEQFLHAVCGR